MTTCLTCCTFRVITEPLIPFITKPSALICHDGSDPVAIATAVVGRIFIMMNGFVKFYEQSKHHDMFVILGSQGSGTHLLARFLVNVFDFSVIRDESLVFNAAVKVRRDPRPSTIKRQLNLLSYKRILQVQVRHFTTNASSIGCTMSSSPILLPK